ncbi:DUF4097 family beta strand repeat-containing protein [Pseudoxanthomonas sp.]|uniref:GIN domain-containing protein n=1 Tax=Pseudoxanthomonas sp. TaxID=1871049 RepID=UPI002616BB05|nr:DUF4097 family beta strand repeat-containing protein [Pseudoxanthomonas sp.]WDS37103.1 MAG: DUF4097 family beta strand repeat-containing protein [Pseudoxanthomonas sp.]
MKSTHRSLLIPALAAVLLATPLLASAQDAHCKFSEPRSLKLDLAGAKSVLFEVGSNDLKLKATAGADSALAGRACASSQDLLKGLTVTQKRSGDKLVVSLAEDRPFKISFGSSYSYLDLTGTVPNDVLVQLDVGSGDASLSGAKAASADVGSGDVDLRDIAGLVTTKIGSGDLKLDGAGALKVLSIGSGDLEAARVTGKAEVGSIGSGDVNLSDVTGDVEVGSIGSGDLTVHGVRGNLTVHSRGSGDIDQRDVTGTVDVPKEH